MSQTVLVTTQGNKHYITDRTIELAFLDLVSVGYSPVEASNNALALVIGRIEAEELSSQDLVYGKSDFTDELTVLATYNSRRSRHSRVYDTARSANG